MLTRYCHRSFHSLNLTAGLQVVQKAGTRERISAPPAFSKSVIHDERDSFLITQSSPARFAEEPPLLSQCLDIYFSSKLMNRATTGRQYEKKLHDKAHLITALQRGQQYVIQVLRIRCADGMLRKWVRLHRVVHAGHGAKSIINEIFRPCIEALYLANSTEMWRKTV
ncbi:hypothetical protein SCHPADRAFT_75514 [Schizopora paradoxa]|uniref:Uncharacterized protein n=1 Tax=Schizopora paradoxa TaxID=27342 RepID=A0A0H2S5C1_9AGAM|nr:hypothetical protein SCHPADRAFT_75514 [Schizopora paradoxa]